MQNLNIDNNDNTNSEICVFFHEVICVNVMHSKETSIMKFVLVLSTECQQRKRNIYYKNIQTKAILKGNISKINKKSNKDLINKLFSEENKEP